MKKTLILAGIGALATTAIVAPQLASAYRGDPSVQGPNYTEEQHEAVTNAFDNGDYEAWRQEMGDKGVARKVNAENFSQFAEAYRLQLAGDTDGATRIRAELGLGLQDGSGARNGNGTGDGTGTGSQYGKNR
jgi:hypothetical protein